MMPTGALYNSLRQYSAETGSDIADNFIQIYKESLKIWDEQYMRPYTAHGESHTQQVQLNLDYLTLPLQRSGHPLSAQEIFVLLSACCLHDIGMQLIDDPEARAKHALYSYQLILNSHAMVGTEDRRITLPIDDRNARIAIALVARGHWTSYTKELDSEYPVYDQKMGRLKLLGALLAMADLLDISPVRARYFRSVHRLYNLEPESGFHQKMHDLVQFGRIREPNAAGELQFELSWHDDSETVENLSEWLLKWYDSQWRQLAPILREESGGAIRWSEPWAKIKFNPPQGPVEKLSTDELKVLQAERTEQRRIDRNCFVKQFRDALEFSEMKLLIFPNEADWDGSFLSDWSEAQARLKAGCLVARLNIEAYSSSIIWDRVAEIFEQWKLQLPFEEHRRLSLPAPDDNKAGKKALERLKSFVRTNATKSFVTIIATNVYKKRYLEPLLESLMWRPQGTALARVCLLLTPQADGPLEMGETTVSVSQKEPFSREDVERHLQTRMGFNESESDDIYSKLLRWGYASKPVKVYEYLDIEYGLATD